MRDVTVPGVPLAAMASTTPAASPTPIGTAKGGTAACTGQAEKVRPRVTTPNIERDSVSHEVGESMPGPLFPKRDKGRPSMRLPGCLSVQPHGREGWLDVRDHGPG